jgi:hypothetical protein
MPSDIDYQLDDCHDAKRTLTVGSLGSNPASATTVSWLQPSCPGRLFRGPDLRDVEVLCVPGKNVLVAMYTRPGAIQSARHSGKDSALER